MEIPFLSDFIRKLRLFFSSNVMKWYTLIFILVILLERVITGVDTVLQGQPIQGTLFVMLFIGGGGMTLFLITGILVALNMQKLIYNDENILITIIQTAIWYMISAFLFIVMINIFAWGLLMFLFVFSWIGWLIYQSYTASETSVKLATIAKIPEITPLHATIAKIASYLTIIITFGSIGMILLSILHLTPFLSGLALIGATFLLMFFIWDYANYRYSLSNKQAVAFNYSLLGVFVTGYAGYFAYNLFMAKDPGLDPLSITISVVTIFYSMAGAGDLISRKMVESEVLKSRWQAGIFGVYFFASGFFFMDSLITVLAPDPGAGAALKNLVKIVVFPLVAAIVGFIRLRKVQRGILASMRGEPEEPTYEIPEEPEPDEAQDETLEPPEPEPLEPDEAQDETLEPPEPPKVTDDDE